ncbi:MULTISPECIES: methylated-DNA--[protein]-cysteine S-methyltransferase [unclassified Lysobacter]|uniref:methylated-DNA--[protein]-cysteine S-methyltransferase n=1 Tax=unclassified Lysobacter TaxID=2635362 RepID=UPI001BEAC0A9|nr:MULTISPECIES: methylated-DNA--[protein]-cysteine S-methyltransferase [unclassified Lysobacter]MBT2745503.1 methylated-DNA--[protein]-cysteine S-methyltransferase [Lysobacter sp. ISL-42]MBT2753442.1 methylated-DNA--[protein]-cysteine S-methyltransferase [Lysobacter sp. ISL-50]MBT2777174.1 methylated-DNA--[protein]-cysteine S-methyltransferase [Lysobacter sp. ISL-54]MBT2780200.1 methylated-DNA--[protein]-cysteine S-methyltransferase [Lysobacter sp. ISL-52]
MNAKTTPRKPESGHAADVSAARDSTLVPPASIKADKLEQARILLEAGEPSLTDLADAVGLSPSHLQRRFSARFGLSPAEYLAQRKLGSLRSALREGSDVSAALYDAGYGSPSRVYESGAARLGMTPARYRAGGAGEQIRWSLARTAIGTALIATTTRGICMIELGDDPAALEAKLRSEFPQAALERVDAGRDEFLAPRVQAVAETLGGQKQSVPVDLIGTAFQKKVWDALMKIPAGQTRSYEQIARQIGSPRGARAVARACANNRVAVVVPCHRVVRGDGSLGGYRWGLPLKEKLLQRERAA